MITNSTSLHHHEGLRVDKENPTSHYMYLNKYTKLKNGIPIYHIFMDGRRVALVDESSNLIHLYQANLSSGILRVML